jgi:hypothetical protein
MIGLDGSGGMRSWPILSIRHATIGGIRTERQPVFSFFYWRGGCGVTQIDESTSSNDEQRGETDHITLARWI